MEKITLCTDSFFYPYRLLGRKIENRSRGCVTLGPRQPRGRALLSYVVHPFRITKQELMRSPHTNPWETLGITELLLDRGFIVDVIDWTNNQFRLKNDYDLVIDVHHNLERLAPALRERCVKIFYATGAQWEFNNRAELRRFANLKERRGIVLTPRRQAQPEQGLELADYATALGSPFSAGTYHASKPIALIPLPTITEFDPPKHKNFDAIHKNFVFIGGGGAVHKGLDLVLEAFADTPEHLLTICAPIEEDFRAAYARELSLPNIKTVGRIDVRGPRFKEIIKNSAGLVYPSCSEGQAGSVIVGLHAGLIPIVTPESGVDVEPFGATLPSDPTVEDIKRRVFWMSTLPKEDLSSRAMAAWTYAREHHTMAKFKEAYGAFLDKVIAERRL